MSKVHFYSPFFFPEEISSGRYNHYLVDALRRRGHEITVVCSYPFYPEWKVSTDFSEFGSPVRVLRGGRSIRYPRSNILRRVILESWFALHCVRSARWLDRSPADLVVDVYPPNLFAVLRSLASKIPAVTVAVVHDLQGVLLDSRTSVIRRLLKVPIRCLERAALRRADRLVFLSQGMMDLAVAMYGTDPGKCVVSYPFSTISKEAPVRVPAALEGSGKTLVYSGALGEKQAPDQLFALMDAFARKRLDFQVHIFSNGPHFDRLAEIGARTRSPVRFNGLVANEELTGLLRRSTIQVIPQKAGLSDGAFPSKLPNLIVSNTATFGITDRDSELSAILTNYPRGAVSHSWNLNGNLRVLEALAARIEALDTDIEDIREVQPPDRQARFQVDELCQVIEGARDEAATKPPRQVPV